MKPIKLKFTGLQSYREEQIIDFQEVGELGIFGIFGPTGGGKSTILDAITLALYGNIERAPNGTRGIMNQFESNLYVSFEFILGDKTYLVERSYRRNKNDDSITNKISRLICINNEDMVLADKAKEVTDKVKEILGMEFTDFTRAVIIPQNKFDQFLKLTEGERAKMLENIFCLEEYGEILAKKSTILKNSLENKNNTIKEIIIELGDASQEAVDKAVEELKTKENEVLGKNKEVKELQEKLQSMEKIAKVYEEIEDLKRKEALLNANVVMIQEKKKKLDKAKEAEAFRNPLNQVETLKSKVIEEKEKLNNQQSYIQEINKELKTAEKKLNDATEGKAKIDDIKINIIPKINLAKSYEEEMTQAKNDLKKHIETIEEKKKALKQLELQLKAEGELHQKNQDTIKNLKVKQRKSQRLFYCRQEVDEAITALAALESQEKQKKETFKNLENKKNTLAKETEILRELACKYIDNSKVKEVDKLPSMAEVILKEFNDLQQETEDLLNETNDKSRAAVLASKLKEGEACRVCGSIHHPNPAFGQEAGEEEIRKLREKHNEAKAEAKVVAKWQQKVAIQHNSYKKVEEEINSFYQPQFDARNEELINSEEAFKDAMEALQTKVDTINDAFKISDRETLRKFKQSIIKAEEEYEKLNKALDGLEEATSKIEEKLSQIKEEYTGLLSDIRSDEKSLESHNKSILILKEKIQKLIGDVTVKEIEGEVKLEIERLQIKFDEATKLWENLKEKNQAEHEKLIELKVGLEKTQEHLQNITLDLEKNAKTKQFDSLEDIHEALISIEIQNTMKNEIKTYEDNLNHLIKTIEALEEKVAETVFDKKEFEKNKEILNEKIKVYKEAVKEEGSLYSHLKSLEQKHNRWVQLQKESKEIQQKIELTSTLNKVLKGRKFVQFLAEEHLRDMAIEASIKLGELTGHRYGLELDDKCNFMMRDDFSNGEKRLVTSLSGGETFLTSLALALALSSKIQLKGEHPLGFFFLDEGFGTLDAEKLDSVIGVLEKLQRDKRIVGIITHVEELKNRMPRYIEVTSAKNNGEGSKLAIKST